jgi:hypothetical protein
MIVVGALVVALCGGCTAFFGVTFGGANDSEGLGKAFLVISLIVGGVPTLVGAGLLVGGLVMLQARRR